MIKRLLLITCLAIVVMGTQARAETLITIDLDSYQFLEKSRLQEVITENWFYTLSSTMSLKEIQALCDEGKIFENFSKDTLFHTSNKGFLNSIKSSFDNYCYDLKIPDRDFFKTEKSYNRSQSIFNGIIEDMSIINKSDKDELIENLSLFYLIITHSNVELSLPQRIILLNKVYKKINNI